MKKIIPVLAAVILLSGCVQHADLDKIAIAEMVGIDSEGGDCMVSLQYFNTDASGGVTAVDGSSPNAVTVNGSGRTVEEALSSVSYLSGKTMMLGALEIIVFGNEAAVELEDRLSFAASHYSGNPRCYVAFTDGKASDILDVKFEEGNASVDKLEGMLSNAEELGHIRNLRMYEAMEMLSEPTESLVMPMMSMYQAGSDYTEDGSSIAITGGALCTGGRLADKLTLSEMSGIRMLTGRNSSCELTLKFGDEDARVRLYSINAQVKPDLEDDKLKLEFELSADCKYVGTSLPDPYGSRGKVREMCEKEMSQRAVEALTKALTLHGADIFGISYKVRSHSPGMWEKIKGDYREYLKDAEFTVKSSVSIERFGIVHG